MNLRRSKGTHNRSSTDIENLTRIDYIQMAYTIARHGKWVREEYDVADFIKWCTCFVLESPDLPTPFEMYLYSTDSGKEVTVWAEGFCRQICGDEAKKIYKVLLERRDFRNWVFAREM